jgi:hypothetical protein
MMTYPRTEVNGTTKGELDVIMCSDCWTFMKSEIDPVVLACGDERRRGNIVRCPECGKEVLANFGETYSDPGSRFDIEVDHL